MAVIGGGAIGCEFASMFADLGTSVTVFEALPTILSGCDDDMVRTVARSFKKRGIDVKAGVTLHGHTPTASGGTVVSFGEGEELAVDAVVVSVGRRPRTEGLVSEDAGVVIDERGFVVADATMRTSAPGRVGGGGRGRRNTAAGPRGVRRVDRGDQVDPRGAGRPRWTTPACRGPSTAIRRWRSPG